MFELEPAHIDCIFQICARPSAYELPDDTRPNSVEEYFSAWQDHWKSHYEGGKGMMEYRFSFNKTGLEYARAKFQF